MYSIMTRTNQRMHLNLGLIIPSGSHDETDSTPLSSGQSQKLNYALQLGSGTVDVSHECVDGKGRRFRRTWRSKYDRMEG